MPDVVNSRFLNYCCIKTATDYMNAHPEPFKDGDVLRCIHCTGGWMMYSKQNNSWDFVTPGAEKLKPINQAAIDTVDAENIRKANIGVIP